MRLLAIALLSIALLLQASLILATPVGLLQHRHAPRKAPVSPMLASRALTTAINPTTPEVGAGSSTLEGRNVDDPSKKEKKGNVQVTGAVVVINNPNGPPKPKENCDEKSFFKKIWCKMTN